MTSSARPVSSPKPVPPSRPRWTGRHEARAPPRCRPCLAWALQGIGRNHLRVRSTRRPAWMDDLSREEVAETLDRAVEELLDAAAVTGPPVDAIALAQGHLGMIV